MSFKTLFIFIFLFSIGGMGLSGYLSWYTLWGPGCTETIVSCGGPEPILIAGQPTCVYGFFMFLMTSILALLGIADKNKRAVLRWLLGVSIVGVGFSGFLTYYEMVVQKLDTLPACAYGLFLYVLILVFTVIGLKKHVELVPTQSHE